MISLLFSGILAATSPTEVRVEIMRTPAELSRGLQGHRPLNDGEGMLFVLPEPEEARFWMKDVTYPIDILFLAPGGEVANIARSAPPCPATPCPVYVSKGSVSHVLEVPAGWSRRFNVAPGTRLTIDERRRTVTVTPAKR